MLDIRSLESEAEEAKDSASARSRPAEPLSEHMCKLYPGWRLCVYLLKADGFCQRRFAINSDKHNDLR